MSLINIIFIFSSGLKIFSTLSIHHPVYGYMVALFVFFLIGTKSTFVYHCFGRSRTSSSQYFKTNNNPILVMIIKCGTDSNINVLIIKKLFLKNSIRHVLLIKSKYKVKFLNCIHPVALKFGEFQPYLYCAKFETLIINRNIDLVTFIQ